MPQLAATLLEPRKSPIQARSTASVDAILEATIQVLLSVGKERLTTTRVAMRAGVDLPRQANADAPVTEPAQRLHRQVEVEVEIGHDAMELRRLQGAAKPQDVLR